MPIYPLFVSGSKSLWRIKAPVGLVNLGNTCYQSTIIQVLINCTALQEYFLLHVGHHHLACNVYRKFEATTKASPRKRLRDICLACELDKLMLMYYGSNVGVNVLETTSEVARNTYGNEVASAISKTSKKNVEPGSPLVCTEFLTATWKCKGMKHLTGYEQKDAHEFLHSFLDNTAKSMKHFREFTSGVINMARESNEFKSPRKVLEAGEFQESQYVFFLFVLLIRTCTLLFLMFIPDPITTMFEGTLRSVLMCEVCGNKRMQSEPFVSLSLPLSKEVDLTTHGFPGESSTLNSHSSALTTPIRPRLSVERCLRHFTKPETLSDPVDCPNCGIKTSTRKQHVISKLPPILCLHLKRFDAASNRKIEDFVSFPAKGLNMGLHLPHWYVNDSAYVMATACVNESHLFLSVPHLSCVM
jgi:ubiquitin carboxyl-terminal hydrolase 22/27/51